MSQSTVETWEITRTFSTFKAVVYDNSETVLPENHEMFVERQLLRYIGHYDDAIREFKVATQNHWDCLCEHYGIAIYLACKQKKNFLCDQIAFRFVNYGSNNWLQLKDEETLITDDYSHITTVDRQDYPICMLFRISYKQIPDNYGLRRIIGNSVAPPNILVYQRKMFEEGILSDVSILVNGLEIPAHKSVLASRSKVFLAMFQAPMREGTTGHVVIRDATYEGVRAMLLYMYCGDTEAITCNLAEVFVLADMYDVTELKLHCSAELSKSIVARNENIFPVAALADKLNDGALFEKCCRRFVTVQNELMNRDDWYSIMTGQREIISKIINFCFKNANFHFT